MLKALRLRVKNAMDAGKSEEQIIQDESITAEYDAQGYGWNFINAERIKRAIFTSLNQ